MTDNAESNVDASVNSLPSETEAATTPAATATIVTSKSEKPQSIKLGYKNFTSGNEACAYFKNIMNSAPIDVNLNEV
jgi:hypothetical protein